MNEIKPRPYELMEFEALIKVKGPVNRHIEQLWDEIKKLKERISHLEKKHVHN